jgi:hypothetical protein
MDIKINNGKTYTCDSIKNLSYDGKLNSEIMECFCRWFKFDRIRVRRYTWCLGLQYNHEISMQLWTKGTFIIVKEFHPSKESAIKRMEELCKLN